MTTVSETQDARHTGAASAPKPVLSGAANPTRVINAQNDAPSKLTQLRHRKRPLGCASWVAARRGGHGGDELARSREPQLAAQIGCVGPRGNDARDGRGSDGEFAENGSGYPGWQRWTFRPEAL